MSNVLPHPAQDHHAGPAPSPNPLAALWRDVARACRAAFAAPHHDTIDDATLRDLGMSRSELGSYAAEASGRAELTRLRVIASQGHHARHPQRGEFE